MKCIGGPMDGREVKEHVGVIAVAGYDDMLYFSTLPTDTDWRDHWDYDWWMYGRPRPATPPRVYEWHERGWQSPEVRAIRAAL